MKETPAFLQKEVEKYERRIKKLTENPDPGRFVGSTLLLYECERDLRLAQIAAWKDGRPLAEGLHIEALLRAMGFEYLDMVWSADTVSADWEKYWNHVRAMGLPDDMCDRTVVFITMCDLGELPVPSFIVTDNHACMPVTHTLNFVSHHYNVPLYCLDLGFESTLDNLDYISGQLRELISLAETSVPGIKFDPQKMVKLQELDKEYYACLRDIYEVRRRVPAPISGRDAVRLVRPPSRYPDAEKGLEYVKAFRDETLARADSGKGAVPNERMRIGWMCNNAYYGDEFQFLESHGASMPIYIMGGYGRFFGVSDGTYGDEREYGKKLSPLEEMARMIRTGWGFDGMPWIREVVKLAKEVGVDGLVNFLQIGCPTTVGLARLVEEEAQKRLGIPTLTIEGRQLCEEGYDAADVHDRLSTFMELIASRKQQQ